MKTWTELVHVTAEYYSAGEYPWSRQAFYEQSVPLRGTDYQARLDDIIITLWEDEGPRAANNDDWWAVDGVWWTANGAPIRDAVDADLRLLVDAVRFEFTPLAAGAGDKNDPPRGLISYEIENMGEADTFTPHLGDLKELTDARIGANTYIALLTTWACEAGFSYVPGEPDEYDTDIQLTGVVK